MELQGKSRQPAPSCISMSMPARGNAGRTPLKRPILPCLMVRQSNSSALTLLYRRLDAGEAARRSSRKKGTWRFSRRVVSRSVPECTRPVRPVGEGQCE